MKDFQYSKNNRPLSVQSRDAYSQTESVDDELFLKDVIIRLPSAKISENEPKITEEVVLNSESNYVHCPLKEQQYERNEEVIEYNSRKYLVQLNHSIFCEIGRN